ncbi:cell envelope integrity protein TolA [Thiobacillus denitrificans]|uniref:Energy transducer TonB n=1 Tax=Thiobacillus denitrificans TaxID=36861 RepID=A0A106BLE1_THIDE|nr:cell envelope integrity protein TolA [Thiobacillus denitrificans]KVW94611.1 energy transducer TonB [Thiobacillus denitrificans]
MNFPADAPFVSRPGSNLIAGALALGVHIAFVLLLVFGVSWQTRHPAPVMVDLWEALPPAPPVAARPSRPSAPAPAPAPVKAPEPVKATPAPRPVVDEPPPPKIPDIVLEKKKAEAERLQKLQAMQLVEEKARADAARAQAEAARKVQEKQLAEQKKRELLRQLEEEDLTRRMADEAVASQARQAKLAEAQAKLADAAAASKRQAEVASVVGQYRDLISAKVRGNTRLPDNLTGNPVVRCLVKLLPTGEVQSVRVTQSSGNAAYDDAVVRAIEKSSPLPLPSARDARAAFVPELTFVHRPKE